MRAVGAFVGTGVGAAGYGKDVEVGGRAACRLDGLVAARAPRRVALRMQEQEDQASPSGEEWKGFGEPPKTREKSKGQLEREAAAQKYEKMQSSGMPEYNVWIRPQDDKNWYPVGSLAVDRSSKIEEAIYENEDALLKGAFRLFPKLQKAGPLEYGFQLKEFPDEPVRLAEKPSASSNMFKDFFDKLLSPLNLDNK
ncbi:hypothetical protein FVE85_7918 [Porphyridium purpureum]|uniref:Uncharacterized protein n=1 Tax=Porphyridium purpureum TaxID=35688 RepID=A0A5J4YLQ3_PORPP|nr:hypothetical protein FVE85_7918 [Porphyridium purpureum]|eukprot:POR2733..scf295_9